VNLFVPSEAKWTRGRYTVTVVQTSDFPEAAHTQLDVTPSEPATFDISFRVPGWCSEFSAEVNEQPVAVAAKPGTWARIRRRWQAGDQVKVRLPMQLRYAAVDQQHPGRVAILYGPVVLVRAERARLPAEKEVSDLLARRGPGLEFHARSTSLSRFTPFYKLAFGDLYEMYFDRE